MGKSQLKQMKESLKERGLLGVKPSQRAKIQKSQKETHKTQLNPYELKFTKSKHEILNRKVKGIKGQPGVARKRATENREKNLLPEMLTKNRDSTFDDKRIGEKNPNLSIEDKMFDRFVQEQKRKQKGSMFNLEEDTLTHMGQSLNTIDDFDANNSDQDEDGHGGIDFKTVRHDHFGGFDDEAPLTAENTGEDGKRKSKAEVMAEVIAKSKFHKQERQKQKEDDLDIGEYLDAEFDLMRDLLFQPQPIVNMPNSTFAERNQGKDYDMFVRELASEKRAKPTDRLKTDQETAMEEKTKLEKLEKERVARMNGSLNENSVANRLPQADDLSDFVFDSSKNRSILEYSKDGQLIDTQDGSEDDSGEELEESESEESGSESESDEEGVNSVESDIEEEKVEDEESGSENEEVEEEQTNDTPIISSAKVITEPIKVAVVAELPFVYTAPKTLEQLHGYTNNKTDKELDIILNRIRVLHSTSLGGDNRAKLQTLLDLLFQDFILQCTSWSLDYMNVLQKHIFELSTQFNEQATLFASEQIIRMQKTLVKKNKFSCAADLMLLKFFGVLFSASDLKHPIIIPAMTLMCEQLTLVPVLNELDALSGLFVCHILNQYCKNTSRFVPEVLNYLYKVIGLTQYSQQTLIQSNYPKHPLDRFLTVDKKVKSFSGLQINLLFDGILSSDDRGMIMVAAYKMLFQQATLMSDSSSFIDIFKTLNEFLVDCKCTSLFTTEITKLDLDMKKALLFRRPLQLQKRKPVPIASYLPKFDEKFSMDRKNNDPNRERAEQQKLKYEHKKEFKGAVRELKRDADFIATQRLKEIKENDLKYKKKINVIMGQLSTQEGAMRGYEKEKKKSRR